MYPCLPGMREGTVETKPPLKVERITGMHSSERHKHNNNSFSNFVCNFSRHGHSTKYVADLLFWAHMLTYVCMYVYTCIYCTILS